MADYVNPFAMYQNTNPVPGNPFASGYQGAQNQEMALPFIEQARQEGALNLQKLGTDVGEYTSPEAALQRSTGRQKETMTNQQEMRVIPRRTDKELKTLDEEIRALPSVTDERIAKAQEAARMAKAGPMRDFYTMLGQSYEPIAAAPESARELMWGGVINRAKGMGIDIPQSFQSWSPQHLADMGMILHSQLFTPEQMGKERITGMQTGSARDVANIGAQASRDVGAGHDVAHIRGAEISAEYGGGTDRQQAQLRRRLQQNPNDEEARTNLLGYLNPKFRQDFEKDSYGQMLRIQSLGDPSKLPQYQTYREQEKARLFMDEGVYGPINAQGRDWVLRAIQANPNAGLDNIIQQGKKLGKFGQPQAPQQPAPGAQAPGVEPIPGMVPPQDMQAFNAVAQGGGPSGATPRAYGPAPAGQPQVAPQPNPAAQQNSQQATPEMMAQRAQMELQNAMERLRSYGAIRQRQDPAGFKQAQDAMYAARMRYQQAQQAYEQSVPQQGPARFRTY